MRHGRIHTLLTDVERLLLVYRLPIIKGALHIYWSALVTMPSCLLLEETAPHDGHGIPLLVSKRAPGWGVRETILENRGIVGSMAYSPDGKLLASVSLGPEVRVWDVATGTVLHTMPVFDTEAAGKPLYPTRAAFSPNSLWIVSGFRDGTVRLWDVVTGSQHRVMRGHTDEVRCVAFSPDGTIIVSCSYDRTLRIWDAGTGTERRVMTGHTDQVHSLAFASHGQTIVSASKDCTLRVWDALTGTELRVINGDNEEFHHVAFSPDGATIALGSSTGTLQLWSATNSTQQHTLEGHTGGVCSFAFSPDSRSIVLCDTSGWVWVWDATTGMEKPWLGGGVTAIACSPDGKSIAMGYVWNSTVRIRDFDTSVAAHPIPEGHQAHISHLTFSSDGQLVASASWDHTMQIWDAVTGTEGHVMKVGEIWCIAFSPNNETVACGHKNGSVQVWDVASGQKQAAMMGRHAHVVHSVAFSSDGNSLVSYSPEDGTARVWDAATGVQQHILTHPFASNAEGRIVAFSADGKIVTTRESYGSHAVMGFWDLTTPQSEYMESTSPHEQTPAVDNAHTYEQHHFGGFNSSWISHHAGQEKPTHVCWLPQERRGCFAYSGAKVCIGAPGGMITILDFSPVDLLQQIVYYSM
jgi:WD40 repeat protein